MVKCLGKQIILIVRKNKNRRTAKCNRVCITLTSKNVCCFSDAPQLGNCFFKQPEVKKKYNYYLITGLISPCGVLLELKKTILL